MSGVIIHRNFIECQDFTIDPYWRDVFYSCACNKFPKGMRYEEESNSLFVKKTTANGRTKTEIIKLPAETEELFKLVQSLCKINLNLYSLNDIKIKKDDLEAVKKKLKAGVDCEWKKIKPKTAKDFTLVEYVSVVKEEKGLDLVQAKNLLSFIKLNILLKTITPDDIDFSKGVITKINGLTYKDEKWSTKRTIKKDSSSEKVSRAHKIPQHLNRFIKEAEKNRNKYNS